MRRRQAGRSRRDTNSALDKGVAINGELQVQLFNMKLLPVKVRLLISSKDLATGLGLDWWRDDAKQRDQDLRAERVPRKPRAQRRRSGAPDLSR
jgi:hypothetical protein